MNGQIDMRRLRAVSLVKVLTNGQVEMTVSGLIREIHKAAELEKIQMDEEIEKAVLNFLISAFKLIDEGYKP